MLKNATLSAIATGLAAIALATQPDKNARQKHGSAKRSDSPVVLPAPDHTDNGQSNGAKAKTDPPPSDTPFHDPNWVLVIVGTITCAVVGWQSFETRRAANATEKSVAHAKHSLILQETAFHQWIDFTEWMSGFSPAPPSNPDYQNMELSFKIANQTAFPIIIEDATFGFGEQPVESIFSMIPDYFLPPKIPYTVEIRVGITKAQFAQYMKDGCLIRVEGSIRYKGVLRRQSVQQVEGQLICVYGRDTVFEPRIPMQPEPDNN